MIIYDVYAEYEIVPSDKLKEILNEVLKDQNIEIPEDLPKITLRQYIGSIECEKPLPMNKLIEFRDNILEKIEEFVKDKNVEVKVRIYEAHPIVD